MESDYSSSRRLVEQESLTPSALITSCAVRRVSASSSAGSGPASTFGSSVLEEEAA
jgi:hypothetical protein